MPTIRAASQADMTALAPFAAQMFTDTFGHLYHADDLQSHLTTHYTPDAFVHLWQTNDVHFNLMHEDDTLIGFAQYGGLRLPLDDAQTPCAELHRLYIHPRAKRGGLGSQLLQRTEEALRPKAAYLYLGVYSENAPALSFYRRFHFTKVGEYVYPVGSHEDREFILCKGLH